jgi:hypothetical protein
MSSIILDKIPHTTIIVDGKPYLTRYYIIPDNDKMNVFLHHFHSSDQFIEFHSHPFKWSHSVMLKRGYIEERWNGNCITRKMVLPFSFNSINSLIFHRVDMLDEEKGCWSIFITGPRIKEEPTWQFWNRNTREITPYTSNPNAIP